MNDEHHNPQQTPEPSGPSNPAHDSEGHPRPRFSHRFWRVAAATFATICLLFLLLVGGALWYSTTAGFQRRVRSIVIAQLEKSTGGRVDIGVLHVNLAQFGIQADNLTIHGKEAPGQVPFLHVDRLTAHLKIIDLFAGKIGLSSLVVTHPTIHVIVYPDGSTNQPAPKVPGKTNASAFSARIFDLAINQARLRDGLLIINDRKFRFDVDASKLHANLSYNRLHKRYLGSFAARDIRLQRGTGQSVTSRLYIQVEASRNHLHLDHLTFRTGDSRLRVTGDLRDFAHPKFRVHIHGSLNLRVLDPLAGIKKVQSGVIRLQAEGSGTPADYALKGTAQLDHLNYQPRQNQSVQLSARTHLLITQNDISASSFHAQFAPGGTVSGRLDIRNWRRFTAPPPQPRTSSRFHIFFLHKKSTPAPQEKPEPPVAGSIHLQVTDLPLNVLLAAIAPPRYQHPGFDTAFSGVVTGRWTGSLRNLGATMNLKLAPARTPAPGEIPVNGSIAASYSLAAGRAQLHTLQLNTPGTRAQASGSLGINPNFSGSKITASLSTRNLAEFDRIVSAFRPSAATHQSSVALHGSASFHGTLTGAISRPSIQGHIQASHLNLAFTSPPISALSASTQQSNPHVKQTSLPSSPAQQPVKHHLHIDSVRADITYTPKQFTLSNAIFTAGHASGSASVTITGHQLSKRHYVFDRSSPVTAQASVRGATLAQLMPLLGTKVPVTGTLAFHMNLSGTLGNPTGNGALTVTGGHAFGEPYTSLQTDFILSGRTLRATNLLYRQQEGQIQGNAQIDLQSRQFHFSLHGANFSLARFHRLQFSRFPVAGSLNFQATGNGTFQHPDITAKLHLVHLNFAHDATGSAQAAAHLRNHTLTLDATAHVDQSVIQLHGQTQLTGEAPAQAKLTVANFNPNPFAKTFHISGLSSRKPINATISLHGPLHRPKMLSGDIQLQPLALSVEKVAVHSPSVIHAALKSGTLTLDTFQIQGDDVDLKAGGSIGLFGHSHPIQWKTEGKLNMKVAETFSDDITSSGIVTFHVHATGTTRHPSLNGEASIQNVNLASNEYINGLSRMNGKLVFNEGRVELKNVTAYSGGGRIQLTGFATYAAGLYVNIHAAAKGVRVRYPAGVTSMVDANMQLQGGLRNLLLSGSVQITHFSVNSTIDLVSMVQSSSGIALPPNPKSFTNRVRLDIHVTSAPSMEFENSFAKLAGTVNLHIRGTAAQPSVLGQVTITEGQAKLAGTTYQLQRGAIYFNNPIRIEPTIDLDATTQVENYNITIGLHGTPNKLQPVFRSSPPLSEQDIFSLLALGRTQEEQQIYAAQQSQAGVNSAANALLGSAINATVSNRIQKLFGGGSVKINPAYVTTSGNATARLTVQQQISKHLTLTYATNVNSSAQQLIQGKWDLTPSLSLLAVRDETGVFSLIFTIRKSYK